MARVTTPCSVVTATTSSHHDVEPSYCNSRSGTRPRSKPAGEIAISGESSSTRSSIVNACSAGDAVLLVNRSSRLPIVTDWIGVSASVVPASNAGQPPSVNTWIWLRGAFRAASTSPSAATSRGVSSSASSITSASPMGRSSWRQLSGIERSSVHCRSRSASVPGSASTAVTMPSCGARSTMRRPKIVVV